MPVKGVTDAPFGLQRAGKIRLGFKRKSRDGTKEVPQQADHFLIPEELKPFLGSAPTKLRIFIPSEDPDVWLPHFLKVYRGSKLTCRGDGEQAQRLQEDGNWREVTCQPDNCAYGKQYKCDFRASALVLLQDVPGLKPYQIDTSSETSARNLLNGAAWVRGLLGRASMVPLVLGYELRRFDVPGLGPTEKRVLTLDTDLTVAELMQHALTAPQPVTNLPAPDEAEDDEEETGTTTDGTTYDRATGEVKSQAPPPETQTIQPPAQPPTATGAAPPAQSPAAPAGNQAPPATRPSLPVLKTPPKPPTQPTLPVDGEQDPASLMNQVSDMLLAADLVRFDAVAKALGWTPAQRAERLQIRMPGPELDDWLEGLEREARRIPPAEPSAEQPPNTAQLIALAEQKGVRLVPAVAKGDIPGVPRAPGLSALGPEDRRVVRRWLQALPDKVPAGAGAGK